MLHLTLESLHQSPHDVDNVLMEHCTRRPPHACYTHAPRRCAAHQARESLARTCSQPQHELRAAHIVPRARTPAAGAVLSARQHSTHPHCTCTCHAQPPFQSQYMMREAARSPHTHRELLACASCAQSSMQTRWTVTPCACDTRLTLHPASFLNRTSPSRAKPQTNTAPPSLLLCHTQRVSMA